MDHARLREGCRHLPGHQSWDDAQSTQTVTQQPMSSIDRMRSFKTKIFSRRNQNYDGMDCMAYRPPPAGMHDWRPASERTQTLGCPTERKEIDGLDHVYIRLGPHVVAWELPEGRGQGPTPCDNWSGLAQLPRNAVNQMLLLGPEGITLHRAAILRTGRRPLES